MPIRKIIIEPDPILRKKSESLEKVDNELRKLMDDMLKTMYAAQYWTSSSPSRYLKKINSN